MRIKANWKSLSAVAGVLLGLLLFFFLAGRLKESLMTDADGMATQKIILDPGHGGIDGGAVGVDGVVEKDINLVISLKLRDLLTAQGYEVIMTHEEDRSIHDEGVTGVGKQKKSDMYNRLAIIEENPDAIVLSIHQNLFEQAKYSGAQMFYGKNNPSSKELAQAIQDSIAALVQPDNTRAIKPGGKDLFLLYRTENPIVLVECGFLSNREEAALLQNEEYQMKLALAIYCGLTGGKPEPEKMSLQRILFTL